MPSHSAHNVSEFQKACDVAQAGDVIAVMPGYYGLPVLLKGCNHVAIRAGAPGMVDGGRRPSPYGLSERPEHGPPDKPSACDPAFLQMFDCNDIIVDGLTLANFWPVIFFIKNSRNITIRNCRMKHATFAIFVKGGSDESHDDGTAGYLIEGNSWQQDDTADHKLWAEYDWAEAHGGEGSSGLLRYFNGAFFGAKAISGDVIIRGNTITDAYNGIRMKAGDQPPSPDKLPRLNANVHIYRNRFERIRDNPIEPEVYALDWHVRHNELIDCHSWFSFDGVGGGYWYFYGNTSRFTSRQGPVGRSAPYDGPRAQAQLRSAQ
jgi:hypothetical protein